MTPAKLRVRFRTGPLAGQTIVIDHEAELGRVGTELPLDDPEVSRRHARLWLDAAEAPMIEDLGSTNGTWVNGDRIATPTKLAAGDRLQVGTSEFTVDAQADGHVSAPAQLTAAGAVATVDLGPVVLTYRPGTQAAARSANYSRDLRRAARRLEFLLPQDRTINVVLSDPYPSDARGERWVTSGVSIEAASATAIVVCSSESPPDPPERVLALLAATIREFDPRVAALVEGYALHLAGAAELDEQLAATRMPPLESAEGEQRLAMAISLVRFLLRHGGDEVLQRFLMAERGSEDRAAEEAWGAGLRVLEERWRNELAKPHADVKAGAFLRLAVRYVRPYSRREYEYLVYVALGLVFTVVFPLEFRRLIDKALPSGRFSEVTSVLVILGIAFLVSLLAELRQTYLAAAVSRAVVRDIRNAMFAKLQTIEAAWFARHDAGDVLSRLFNDVELLEYGLSLALRQGIAQLATFAVCITTLFVLSPVLGLLVFVGAPIVSVVYRLMSAGARRRSIVVQESLGELSSVAQENLFAQRVVKALGLERHEKGRFERSSERQYKHELSITLYGGLFELSVSTIVVLLRIAVLGLGAYLIFHHHLTIGTLVAFISLMGQAISPVTALTGLGQQIQSSSGALIRIQEVLEVEPAVADVAQPAVLEPLVGAIALKGVSFSHGPDRQVLTDISAEIPRGARVAFVGPSGAGKSSVLQLLPRFADPDGGTIEWDGCDLRSVSLASLRSRIGFVFQDTFLFNSTIAQNIALGKEGATAEDVREAARIAGLDEADDALPDGLEAIAGEGGGRLSGGQRQRVAIARAVIREPELLLLDEATSALDPRTERQVNEAIRRAADQRTVISVTHRLASVVDYDRIYVLAAGKIVEFGTHADLLERGGLYAELWSEQTGAPPPAPRAHDARVVEALQRTPLLIGATDEDVDRVAASMLRRSAASGELIHEDGSITVIMDGEAEVMVARSGQLRAVSRLRPGDVFGVAGSLGAGEDSILRAVTPLRLAVLPVAEAEKLLVQARRDTSSLAAIGNVVLAGERHISASGVMSAPPIPSRAGTVIMPQPSVIGHGALDAGVPGTRPVA